jgi:hypothetical protein
MMDIYAGTIVEQVLLFKEALWDLFDDSAYPVSGRQEPLWSFNKIGKESVFVLRAIGHLHAYGWGPAV